MDITIPIPDDQYEVVLDAFAGGTDDPSDREAALIAKVQVWVASVAAVHAARQARDRVAEGFGIDLAAAGGQAGPQSGRERAEQRRAAR